MLENNISPNSLVANLKDLFSHLYNIIVILRSPEGCPWDRAQNLSSLKDCLIEEAYEVVSAIDNNDSLNLCEELGDLLLLVILLSRIAEETDSFSLADVLKNIIDKIIRRHPHVFQQKQELAFSEILTNWNYIKEHIEGKKKNPGLLSEIPNSLPPLEKAYQIQKAVAKVGFDWSEKTDILKKLDEEVKEFKEAIQKGRAKNIEEEIGDLFFTIINLSRFLKINPALALQKTNSKFQNRFFEMENYLKSQNRQLKDLSLEELDNLWNSIKQKEK